MGQPEHPPVVLKTYDFTLWLLPKVEKFNRAYPFTVGERARDVERSREGGFAAGAAATRVAAGVQFHFRIAFPTPGEGRPASNIQAAPVLW